MIKDRYQKKYYVSYKVKKFRNNKFRMNEIKDWGKTVYLITAKYFVHRGDLLEDSIDIKTEKNKVSMEKIFKRVEALRYSINNTQKEIAIELRRMGANDRLVEYILKTKGFGHEGM